jgi:hypothetical protein
MRNGKGISSRPGNRPTSLPGLHPAHENAKGRNAFYAPPFRMNLMAQVYRRVFCSTSLFNSVISTFHRVSPIRCRTKYSALCQNQ